MDPSVDIERLVKDFNARLDELATAQKSSRLRILFGSAVLLGMICLFGTSLYNALQERLSQDKLQDALLAKVDEMWPPLSEKLVNAVMDAAPTYGDLAMKRLSDSWPKLEAKIIDESGSFAERMQEVITKRSEESMQRVASKLSKDLKEDFPSMTETRVEALANRLAAGLLGEGADLAEEMQTTIEKEEKRIEALMGKLPVDEWAKIPEDKLQRQFMHNLLMMLDDMVMTDTETKK